MSAYMPIITPKEMSGIERNVTILTGRDKAIPWLLPGVARNTAPAIQRMNESL